MDELQNIQNLIYVIRGQRVMLDFDLAKIYQVETKYLKRQVRRNIERFEGDDFMFEVSQEEILRCQNVTSSWGGSRYGAFAFTEIGVAMLSGVLNSKVAVEAARSDACPFVLSSRLSAAHGALGFAAWLVQEISLPLYDILKPSSSTLSRITPLVATTPTRIWLFSWNQPKIPVPLHQFHTFS